MRQIVAISCFLLAGPWWVPVARSEQPLRWDRGPSSIALASERGVVWKFHYHSDLDVPYFHPVSTLDGHVLTWDQPPDHRWHHGLWFCWKYINDVNYWEPDRQTGKPAGQTTWSDVRIDLRDDYSATISLPLAYRPAGQDEAVLREQRRIDLSAPDVDGGFRVDWTSEFTAGRNGVELDRTPPAEQSWGGYAGLSVRFSKQLADRQATSDTEKVQFGAGDRYRGKALGMDYSGMIDGQPVGLAFLDHPENVRHPTPWYVIRSPVMSYINAAVLNDQPMTLEPNQGLTLRYRLIVHPGRWDTTRLRTAHREYVSASPRVGGD